jgi:hypothetical protein
MKARLFIFFMLMAPLCMGQKTWYGEISGFAGGGTNSIFRVDELVGAGSVTGTGMWTAGIDLRRLFGDHFSLETGLGYSHQYYYTSPAPGVPGDDVSGSFGLIIIPVTARFDFLKWFFADAGLVTSLRTGNAYAELTGLGATVGAGFQYNFKSDVFIRIRAYGSQYAMLHFIPEEYPHTLWNSGVTIGAGYRFIRLGKCNCPDGYRPKRKFY